ncbi:hypothetical protein [Thermosyntropha sp.]|uniref:hypothetical protein n=1 Tax=Thermosyntropha sp. TaxID=2740820 RepID=UPI0025EB1416|nr:hypothetical protein [Thermosyntropha sp.]MBO8157937.1 hypothetical protein [Thermosyntropha sp.]
MLKKYLSFIMAVIILLSFPGTGKGAENPFIQGYIEGYLAGISLPEPDKDGQLASSGSITVETYDGEMFNISLSPKFSASIDRRPAKITDFKAGIEVYARIVDKQVVLLEGYSVAGTSYISPGSKIRRGMISGIENDQLILKDYAGAKEIYYISPATLIMKRGKVITPDLLYAGDKVKLYFDEINSSMISRLEVEGDSVLVNNLYKGKLKTADFKGEKLVLSDVFIWRNGRWQTQSGLLYLPYSTGIAPFIGGQKINEAKLSYYQGKDVYVITKNILGRETAERIFLKNQYETVVADKVLDINWYVDKFELKNKSNFAVHEGSAVIKDGRLQDKMTLSSGDDVLVIADGRGINRLANIIYIYNQGINNSSLGQHYLYVGRLEQVAEYKIWLKDYFLLAGNSWESYTGVKELYYDNDSFFYDAKKKSLISSEEFLAGDYAVDEDSERVKEEGLKDWYAYIWTDGDRASSLLLQEDMDSLLRQRVTGGIIAEIENDEAAGWTIQIREPVDWSGVKEQWMPKTANLRVNVDKAMIIKDNCLILPEELKTGDRLYIVRDDFYAKVVIVK